MLVGAFAHIGSQELWQTLKARRLGLDARARFLVSGAVHGGSATTRRRNRYVRADIIKISDARNRQVHGEGRDEK